LLFAENILEMLQDMPRKNPALQDSLPAAGRFATDFIPAAVR